MIIDQQLSVVRVRQNMYNDNENLVESFWWLARNRIN